MQDKAGSLISSKQLIFMIVGTQVATEIFALPRVVSAKAGEDAWIAVILGALVPFISLFLIERLGKRMPEMGFTQMTQALFGKIIGSFLVVIFVAYAIFFESIVVRILAEVARLYLLPKTPVAVIIFIFIFITIYIGTKGLRVIARLNELLFYIILLNLLLLILIPLGMADYTNILPVGEVGLDGLVRGALTTGFQYQGIEILLVFYTLVTKKNEVLKAGTTALAITTLLYAGVVLVCELVLGITSIQKLIWPALTLLKTPQIPVFERLEFIFLFFWMGMGVRPLLNMSFASSLSLSQLFKIDQKKYLPYFMILIGLGMYILALLPHDIFVTYKLADYAGYAFLVIGLGYPLLYHMMAFLRGKKVGESG
ncbi:MAG: endospore germination permease [Syntrophomonas sp.]|nr:endospore germination permease [Syntrophomonas sp.]